MNSFHFFVTWNFTIFYPILKDNFAAYSNLGWKLFSFQSFKHIVSQPDSKFCWETCDYQMGHVFIRDLTFVSCNFQYNFFVFLTWHFNYDMMLGSSFPVIYIVFLVSCAAWMLTSLSKFEKLSAINSLNSFYASEAYLAFQRYLNLF